MKALQWTGELDFEIDGVSFRCAIGDYSGKTSREKILLLKDRTVLDQYAAVLAGRVPKNILEFGIFQGGSPALFSLWCEAEKFVGIDICDPVPAFDEFCRSHALGERIRSYYHVAQTDEQQINEIAAREFGSKPLDLIIDDASHEYRNSRRTFEIAFPLLRPGGLYVIEDWGWAHWTGFELGEQHAGTTPLSMLIMELTMLCASRPDLIGEVRVFPAFAFVRKAEQAPYAERLSLDGLYIKRNIEVLGAGDLMRLGAVFRLLGTRVLQRSRRRLGRTLTKLRRALRPRQ